jgi:hypothetical protein
MVENIQTVSSSEGTRITFNFGIINYLNGKVNWHCLFKDNVCNSLRRTRNETVHSTGLSLIVYIFETGRNKLLVLMPVK